MVDHSHHNYGVDRTGVSVDLFNFVTGHGWLSLYFFVIALILVLATDLNVILRILPPLPELKIPLAGLLSSRKAALSVWNFIVTKRSLAFASFHYRNEPAAVRSSQLDPVLYGLLQRLVELRNHSKPSVQGPQIVQPNDPYPANPRTT
jgi:hypothetical protein